MNLKCIHLSENLLTHRSKVGELNDESEVGRRHRDGEGRSSGTFKSHQNHNGLFGDIFLIDLT